MRGTGGKIDPGEVNLEGGVYYLGPVLTQGGHRGLHTFLVVKAVFALDSGHFLAFYRFQHGKVPQTGPLELPFHLPNPNPTGSNSLRMG